MLYIFLLAFTETPASFNASQGSLIDFHCEVDQDQVSVFWLVNDDIFNSANNRNRSITLHVQNNVYSTLTIVGHLWNDNAEIQCAFHSYQSTNVSCSNETVTCSEKAILRVQGDLIYLKCIVRSLLLLQSHKNTCRFAIITIES